jgi:hypothetical protein
MMEEYDHSEAVGFLKIVGLSRLAQLQHEGAMTQIACGKLCANTA